MSRWTGFFHGAAAAFLLVVGAMVVQFFFAGQQRNLFYALALAAALILLYVCIRGMEERRAPALFLGILLAGGALRLIWICTAFTVPISDYKTIFDSAAAAAAGQDGVFGQGTYFHRFPHLTFFTVTLSLLFRLFGPQLFLVKLVNVGCGCLSIWGMYEIGKTLHDKRFGCLCAGLMSVFVPYIYYCSVVASENFAMPLLVFSVMFLLRAYRSEERKRCVFLCALCGLTLCAGSLFRGVAPLYLAAYVIGIGVVFARGRRLRSIVAMLLSFGVLWQGVSLSLLASGVTSYRLEEGATPLSLFFLIGFNFETHGMFSAEDHQIYFEAGGDKEKMEDMIWDRLGQRLQENGGKIVEHLWKKTQILWADGDFAGCYWSYDMSGTDGEKPHLALFYALGRIFYLALLLGAIYFVFARRKDGSVCLLGLILLGFEGAYLLLEVQPRYTFSAAYVFAVLGAAGIHALLEDAGQMEKQKRIEIG